MQQTVRWYGIGRTGQSEEQCDITTGKAGVEVRGQVQGVTPEGEEYEIRYILELSPEWDIQHVTVADAKDEGRLLDLQRENGQWLDSDGMHLEEFDGVEFVDLSITPLTNTLPIKRMDLSDRVAHEIAVLYIDLPAFDIRKETQYYTAVGNRIYHFQAGEAMEFSADLVMGNDDLVLMYPDQFLRRHE